MQTHNIHAAKTHFSQRVDAAAGGETIIIAKAGVPVAKLVPIEAPKRRGMLPNVRFNAEASDAMDAGYVGLPITAAHGLTVGALPLHHRDPFDRIMVSQAMAEGISLVTNDSAMRAYPHTIIV